MKLMRRHISSPSFTNWVGCNQVPQIVLQTSIPSADSEILLGIAILIWLIVALRLAHKLDKMWKYFGDVASFLLFFLGVLLIELAFS
jgi:hypothetical protein